MAEEFSVSDGALKELAQGFLDAKAKARSIENMAEAFLPLTDSPVVTELLTRAVGLAQELAFINSELYRAIAKEAMDA